MLLIFYFVITGFNGFVMKNKNFISETHSKNGDCLWCKDESNASFNSIHSNMVEP